MLLETLVASLSLILATGVYLANKRAKAHLALKHPRIIGAGARAIQQ